VKIIFEIGQCEHFIALCHGVNGGLDLAYKHETRANEIFKLNRLNPSKFWRRKFRPASVAVSSSDSEGGMGAPDDSPLEWFCFHAIDFKGKLATHRLISCLNDLRTKARTRHQPILRSSPEYKPRRSPLDLITERIGSYSPERETKSNSPRNKYISNSTAINTDLNTVLPTLTLNQTEKDSVTKNPPPNPQSQQNRKSRSSRRKNSTPTPPKNSTQQAENIVILKHKVMTHEQNLRFKIEQQKKDPRLISKEEIRMEVLTLKDLKQQIESLESFLLPSTIL